MAESPGSSAGQSPAERPEAGPVFLITGASSGIGEATARHAAGAGYRVVLAARSTDKLEALAAELGGLAVTCDVTEWAGDVTEADLVERFALVWPRFFVDPGKAQPPPARVGVEASIGTNRSVSEHFERGTLRGQLPEVTLPALFIHGQETPCR